MRKDKGALHRSLTARGKSTRSMDYERVWGLDIDVNMWPIN